MVRTPKRLSCALMDLEQIAALLARTPASLDALLRDLPDAWTRPNEGENTWNALDIVDHLIHGEHVIWMPRARHLLEFGETRPFETFDRAGFRAEGRDPSLGELLDAFALVRAQNLRDLRALHLQPSDLERRGLHPTFGSVTLAQLLATWSTHDLTHLHQLTRVLAHQCREAVGPWTVVLGVLQCAGHSA
jgi:hypothetical protein